MSELPVRKVELTRPRSKLSATNLKNAFKVRFLPQVTKELHIVAVRCVFDFCSQAEVVRQLAARRRALEIKLLECKEVI